MNKENVFYVYEHHRPDTGECFYVGKGRAHRAWAMARRSDAHRAITSKLTSLGLSVDVRIIILDVSEQTSYAVEKDRIAFYGLRNLVNKSEGGRGGRSGIKPKPLSEEEKRRIGEAASKRHGNLGKKIHTEKSKEKLRAHGHKNIGVFRQYAGAGPRALAKKVCCLNDQKIYESAAAAARHYKVSKSALIELCLNKNGRKTVGGLMFRYVLEAA